MAAEVIMEKKSLIVLTKQGNNSLAILKVSVNIFDISIKRNL